jgi:hypothetical protein
VEAFADAEPVDSGPAEPQADGLFPADCSVLLAPDDYLADSLLDDCSVVPARADSAVGMDDSVAPDSSQRAARSEQVDCPADSSADSRAVRVAPDVQCLA